MEDERAILDSLVTERDDALAEATRLRNQQHQFLLQLDPEYKQHPPTLTSKAGVQAVVAYQPPSQRELDHVPAAAVRRLAARLQLVVEQNGALAGQPLCQSKHRDGLLTLGSCWQWGRLP